MAKEIDRIKLWLSFTVMIVEKDINAFRTVNPLDIKIVNIQFLEISLVNFKSILFSFFLLP